jgi:hypothetical protein
MTFLAVAVLFKTTPSKSVTLVSLAAAMARRSDCRLIVWDNSPASASDAELRWLKEGFSDAAYRSTPENWPLSRIYNAIIDEFFRGEQQTAEYLVLLDQDSRIPSELLCKAADMGAQYPGVGLFLPLVWSNGVLVSPADLWWFRGRLWHYAHTGLIRARFRSAINSGMVIRASYLRGRFQGYDSRLRFYGTDSYFVEKYAATEEHIGVLNCSIHHDLASNHAETRAVKLWRHADVMRAIRCMNERPALRRVLSLAYCAAFSVKLALRHREWGYLQWKQ